MDQEGYVNYVAYVSTVIPEHQKHPIDSVTDTAGSCSMLPKANGGVVDSHLKVRYLHIGVLA